MKFGRAEAETMIGSSSWRGLLLLFPAGDCDDEDQHAAAVRGGNPYNNSLGVQTDIYSILFYAFKTYNTYVVHTTQCQIKFFKTVHVY